MAITVPSWCSEKASNVSVKPSLIASTTIASVVFFFVGIIGTLTLPPHAALAGCRVNSPHTTRHTHDTQARWRSCTRATTIC
jgi:hypothetical protein